MRRLCVVASAFAAIFLEACTTPVAREEARSPSSSRVLLRQYQNKANGNSAVVMTRDNETISSGCGITVTIDQKSVVILEPGEVFVAYLNAANHNLGTRFLKPCAGRAENFAITTHPGKVLEVRIRYAVISDAFQTIGETDFVNVER